MTTVPVLLFTLFCTQLSPTATTSSIPARSSSDAWLWHRDIKDPVAAVAAFSRFSSGRLHILAADDAFESANTDLATALAAARLPVVLTVRLTTLPPTPARVVTILQWWRERGVDVVAAEIDHDCGTAQLAHYATWLTAVKTALSTTQPTTALSITALPAWLLHRDHRRVFSAVDDVTVQVHAIRAPSLFDKDTALRVIRTRPELAIALPTYAVTLKGGIPIFADPHDVSVVAAAAARVVWFRLPELGKADDASAWSLSTLQAVDRGVVAAGHLEVALAPHKDGAVSVVVENNGAVDVPLIAVIVRGAVVADAVAGFAVAPIAAGWRITPTTARFVAPGTQVVVGWARAAKGAVLTAAVEER